MGVTLEGELNRLELSRYQTGGLDGEGGGYVWDTFDYTLDDWTDDLISREIGVFLGWSQNAIDKGYVGMSAFAVNGLAGMYFDLGFPGGGEALGYGDYMFSVMDQRMEQV